MNHPTKPKPLEIQHGGNHYKNLAIEPIYFAEINGLSASQFSVVKYLTRFPFKQGLLDLNKSGHFSDMLNHFIFIEKMPLRSAQWGYEFTFTPEHYCDVNKIEGLPRDAIIKICRFKTPAELADAIDDIKQLIEAAPVYISPEKVLINKLAITIQVAQNRLKGWMRPSINEKNMEVQQNFTKETLKVIKTLLKEVQQELDQ